MNIHQVNELIQGVIAVEPIVGQVYRKAFASDLMSDVLRFHMEDTILITGLCTVQALRTAEMSNITCLIFARGKRVTDDMLALAKELHIAIIVAESTMFEISGKLYQNGIKPVY